LRKMAEDPEAPDSAFAGLARAQKAAKLHTLLEKSSKYTDFLFERIRQQQQRARESGPASGASGASGSGEEGGEDPAAKRVPPLFRGELREYQLTGVEWLKALFENGLNGILADEMGLGKTVQVVAFLCHLYAMRVSGPYLIVGPLSTLGNWMAELQRFAPDIPAVLYHGSPEERAALRPGLAQRGKGCGGKTVVTSFEIVMRDRKHLARLPWKYIIVDEGHRLKNLNCKLIRELKTYQSANRLLLSGTPLQNHLAELWSLLNFLLPDIFDDLENFQRWFDIEEMGAADADSHRILEREQESQVLTKLHHILQPFLLRRLKVNRVVKKGLCAAHFNTNNPIFPSHLYLHVAPIITTDRRRNRHPAQKRAGSVRADVGAAVAVVQRHFEQNHFREAGRGCWRDPRS
jgi:SNF2 family DNA or RNA helicase